MGWRRLGRRHLRCKSLKRIVILNTIKAIKYGAFQYCSGLTAVTLGNGLKDIGKWAFKECTLRQCIIIPPVIKAIDDCAFKDCSNLMNVVFCDKIEWFVSSMGMHDCWNQSVPEKSLNSYCFLVKCIIPEVWVLS
jgi:hypothetical protein